jgi:hypothetical protein
VGREKAYVLARRGNVLAPGIETLASKQSQEPVRLLGSEQEDLVLEMLVGTGEGPVSME